MLPRSLKLHIFHTLESTGEVEYRNGKGVFEACTGPPAPGVTIADVPRGRRVLQVLGASVRLVVVVL